jgi:hypothetical protein
MMKGKVKNNLVRFVWLFMVYFLVAVLTVLVVNFFGITDATLQAVLIGLNIGIVLLVSEIIFRKKFPDLAKRQEIVAKDERNVQLNSKASSVSWLTSLVSFTVLLTVANMDERFELLFWLIFLALAVHVASFLIARVVISRKM